MTEEEQAILAYGRIPAPPISALVRRYIAECGPEPPQHASGGRLPSHMTTLAHAAGLSDDLLYDTVGRERVPSFAFAAADALLDAMECSYYWHTDPTLSEYYQAVSLADEMVCANDLCENTFPPALRGNASSQKIFCSKHCQYAARKAALRANQLVTA